MPTEADNKPRVPTITQSDKDMAEVFLKEIASSDRVFDLASEAIAFAREQLSQDSKPAEPPLPDKLPAHCFDIVDCERSRWYPASNGSMVYGFTSGCDVVTTFVRVKRRIPLPPGSVVFVATGEVRPPKCGEWFITKDGSCLQALTDFVGEYPIVHRIEVTE